VERLPFEVAWGARFVKEVAFEMVGRVLMPTVALILEYIDALDLRTRLEACYGLRLTSQDGYLVDTEGSKRRLNRMNLPLVHERFRILRHWPFRRPWRKYSCHRTSIQETDLQVLFELDEEVVSLVI
jgi:hypothetical protein